MPRETHAPGPKTRATPLQRYISTLLTCKVTLAGSPQHQAESSSYPAVWWFVAAYEKRVRIGVAQK